MAIKELFVLLFLTLHITCERNSLTFVIDDTGSMWEEIYQVKIAAKSIVDIVKDGKTTQIDDIVLVTFNDPGVKKRISTHDANELKKELNSIDPSGGVGDCTEMALEGIKQALLASQQGSYLFVFTDAPANDFVKYDEVRTLAQQKQSQIVFFVTDGLCPSRSLHVYHELARDSNGQVFRMGKHDISKVLEYVKEIIKGDRTVIKSEIVPANHWNTIEFNVDDQTEYVIVSVSGKNVQMEVQDASGRLLGNNKYINIVTIQNALVIKVPNAVSSRYKVKVKGKSDVNVIIFGRTDFTFVHEFSESTESSPTTVPTIGVESHLIITLKDPKNSVTVKSVELLDMKGDSIKLMRPLRLTHVQGNVYTTDKFMSPEQKFQITVIATSRQTGKDIRRIGKTPVQPVKPVEEKPVITVIKESLKVKEGESINLLCRVQGTPKPSITWYLKQHDAADFKEIKGEYKETLHVRNATTNDYYMCVATNKVGYDNFTRQLDVQVRPEFVNTPNVITKNEGEPVTIDCRLRKGSPRPERIEWQFKRVGWSGFRQFKHAAEQLNIPEALPEQAGVYQCNATNELGSCQKSTTLVIQVKPVIEILEPIIEAMEHSTVTLRCRVTKGFPKPTVDWYYEGPSAVYNITSGSEVIQLKNIKLNNAGHYKCVVENILHRTEGHVQVIVNAPPRIVSEMTYYEGVEGDVVMKLPCAAVGHPTPTITWVVDEHVVGSDKSKDKYVEDNSLFLKNPMEKHSTIINETISHSYVCKAHNYYDTAVQTCNVTISKYADFGKTDVIYALLKHSYDVQCPLPYTDPNSVRWFKNSYNLYKTGPTLHIENSTRIDEGNYTCRVSDLKGATSHTLEVYFGSPPTREENRLSLDKIWNGDSSETIDCSSKEDPTGMYTWFYNGVKLEGQNSYSLPLTGWGQYTCNVLNVHGSLVVNFKVKGQDCGIPTSLFKTKHMPVLLESSFEWPSLTNGGRYIIVPKWEKLSLFCPGQDLGKTSSSFTKFPHLNSVVATCDHEELFLVDGSLKKLSELDCKNNVEYRLHDTTTACLGENTKLYKIGYSLQDADKKFITVYESCRDTIKDVPLYTKIKTIPVKVTGEVNTRLAKRACVDESKCCYESIQLVNEQDVGFGPPQKATHIDSFNSVKYCNPKNTSWYDLEQISRSETRFIVWSGAAQYEKIGSTWTPKYIWKVLKDAESFETLAVINENVLSPGDKVCSGDCGGWIEPQGNRTYCCNLKDFKISLGITIDFDDMTI